MGEVIGDTGTNRFYHTPNKVYDTEYNETHSGFYKTASAKYEIYKINDGIIETRLHRNDGGTIMVYHDMKTTYGIWLTRNNSTDFVNSIYLAALYALDIKLDIQSNVDFIINDIVDLYIFTLKLNYSYDIDPDEAALFLTEDIGLLEHTIKTFVTSLMKAIRVLYEENTYSLLKNAN